MAGYLGTKAVFLSTTAASVTGNSTITGSVTAGSATVSGDLTVDTNTLYVDSTNNKVGIGTSSPASFFSGGNQLVVGDGSGAQGLTIYAESTNHGQILFADGTTGNEAYRGILRYDHVTDSMQIMTAGATERMRIDSSGNVGIGTSTPDDYRLHIYRGASSLLHLESTTATASIDFTNSGGTARLISQNANLIFNNGSERMRIDSSGNVGIRITNPTYPLTVSQSAAGLFAQSIYAVDNTAATRYMIGFKKADGTTIGSITTNNSNSTSYNTSSDYRLKEDWQPMTGASDRVLALNPVNFAWKVDGSRVDGFLAHEAQAVVPEAVTGAKDAMRDEEYEVTPAVLDEKGNVVTEAVMGTREVPDYQGIDQSKFVPLLTAALQEALTEIADLKARVTALETV